MKREHLHVTKDALLFVLGVAGLTHEVLRTGTDRPSLIVLFGAMLGLPFIQNFDRKKNS